MSAQPYAPVSSPLRGIIVGAGYFARFQYEAWTRIPEVTITAASNRTVEKARTLCEEFGIPRWYDDWQEAIEREKPDFVDIITPPSTHLEICSFCAERGITIICQKPLAPTYDESVAIVNLAARSKGRFMVHENWRWQPWYRQIKRTLDEGTIGSIHSIAVRMRMGDGWGEDAYLARQPFFRDYPRLLVFETGVHFLDTFRYLGGEVESVYCATRRCNPVIKGEDTAHVVCKLRSGAVALLDANRYNEVETEDPRYTFGTVRIDGSSGHLELSTDAALRVKPLGAPGYELTYPHRKVNFAGDCVYALQRHFADAMLTGQEFEPNGPDYLKTLRLVEACYTSARENGVVRI